MNIRTILILLLTLISFDTFAALKVTLDRNNIRQNETFTLYIEAEDQKTLSANHQLDFLPREFNVLATRPFNNRTVVQGKYAHQFGWKLILNATEAGTYTIPSFTIGAESSTPITIRVLPPLDDLEQLNPNSQVKLSARISSEKVYVQQQIIYTLRVYSSVNTRRKAITPLIASNAQIEKVGNTTEFETISNGVKYGVLEQKYAIFPQKSGELFIEPIVFRTHIFDSSATYGASSRYQQIELKSKPFKVEVMPQPTSAESPWIPARDIKIETQWQDKKNKLEVGVPASLDVIIKGVGLLPEQLPELVFPEVSGLKIYRDKPNLQTRVNRFGINSYHFETLAIIPNTAGKVEIPEIKIPFWNTKTNQQDYAIFNKLVLDIAESKSNPSTITASNKATPVAVIPEGSSENNPTQAKSNPLWKYLAFIFCGLWLITLIFIFVVRKKWGKPAITSKQAKDLSQQQISNKNQLFATIDKAFQERDLAKLRKAIISWGSQQTPRQITNMEQLLDFAKSENHRKDLMNDFALLNNSLYNKDAPNHDSNYWQQSKLLDNLKALDFQPKKTQQNVLPPLYPE